jgi:parvulin-like peptidyl-prolyl isomerase
VPRILVGLLLLSAACISTAQAPSPAPAPASSAAATTPAATAPAVAADTPVITIEGVCQAPAADKSCRTVVTREEFERTTQALQPQMPQQFQRQFANNYARLLVLAYQARQRSLEKTPRFDQLTQLSHMQILQQLLSQAVQDEAKNVPDADLQKYYGENKANFEEAELVRLYVPKDRAPAPKPAAAKTAGGKSLGAAPAKASASKADDDAFMKSVAAKLHARAVAGEDFDALQKEAFAAARLKAGSPSTKLGKITRSAVPSPHRAVFDLKPGEVSQLLAESNGFYIYKLVSRRDIPLEEVKEQIVNTLQGQRFQQKMQELMTSAKPQFNETYFPAPKAPPAPPTDPAQKQGEDDDDDKE